jgi:hypothetical protein
MSLKIYGLNPTKQLPVINSMVHEAVAHPVRVEWLKDADKANRYYQGQHWDATELAELKRRNQPDIVYNEIRATVRRLVGQYRRQQLVNTLTGRNAPVDDDLANVLSEVIRFVDQDTEYLFEEKEMVRDGLVSGFGVVECGVETGPMGTPRIFLNYEDSFHIFPDPFCRRYDWNNPRGGARYILRSKWLNIEEAKERWPKSAAKLERCLGSVHPNVQLAQDMDPTVLFTATNHFFDRERRLIRPVECWFKQRVNERVLVTPAGVFGPEYGDDFLRKARAYFKSASTWTDQDRDCMYVAVICGDVLVQPATRSPYRTNKFPFIPFYADRKKDGQPVGYIWDLIDPNREINSRRSRALYMLNNRQSIYERGAVSDQVKLADELAKSDGQIVLEPGKMERFIMRENQDIGQANLQMLQEAKMELNHLSGEDHLDVGGEMRSGAGVQASQMPYHLSQVDLMDNLSRTRRMKTLLVIDYIQQYYDEDMVFQVTDDEGKAQTVAVSAAQFENIKARTFDLVIREQPNYTTSQEEAWSQLNTTLPQVVQYGPQWGKVLLLSSPLRDKEKYIKLLEDAESGPSTIPKVSLSINWTELMPQEKAEFANLFGLPSLAQYEQSEGRRPQHDDKMNVELQKTLIREGTRVGLEQGKQTIQERDALAAHQLALRQQDLDMQAQQQQQQADQQMAAQQQSADERMAQTKGSSSE